MGKLAYRLGWVLLAFAAIGLTAYVASLRQRARELEIRAANLQQTAEDQKNLKREKKRGIAAVHDARFCLGSERSKDQKLLAMLRECTSRDDFLVREGPRIVWSELAHDSAGVKSLAFYLPAGMHHLKFKPRQPADSDADYHLSLNLETQAVGCELGPHPEVYEIQFFSDDVEGEARVVVRGGDNRVVFRSVIPGVEAPREIGLKTSPDGFAYPSEVKFEGVAGRKLGLPLLRPVTELATLQTNPRLRVQIDSDARPCVSAIAAAANYDEAALLGDAEQLRWKEPLGKNSDDEFARRFLPYDGSGVLYLRENMIFSQND
jgi:hypothetical protein